MAETWILPRETVEWVGPIAVSLNGTPSASSWQVAVVANGQHTPTWSTPDSLDGGLGVIVGPGTQHVLPVGNYHVWVKVTGSAPEAPVLDEVGSIIIT